MRGVLDKIFKRRQVPAAIPWKPARLFTTGVNGAWYDPSDINLTWRRNLLTYSEQFDNAAWNKTNTTVQTDVAIAPDGTLSADKLIPSTTAAAHYATNSITSTTQQCTASIYVKLDGSSVNKVTLYPGSSGSFAHFNLSTLATNNEANVNSSVISPVGNGWYRLQATWVAGISISVLRVYASSGTLGADAIAGDGYSGIYIWGAQLELGSTATPYQRITDGIQNYLSYRAQPVLFQDAAGTTPVTAVGQPVGLMLDKSKGLVLGPELVTNGGFASNLTGWSQSTANYWTWVNGRAYHANSTNYNDLFQNFTIFSKPVQIEFDYECLTAANTAQWFYINAAGVVKSFDSAGVPRLGSGAGKMRYVALDGIQKIGFSRYSQAEFYIDNISVRELPGNHAFNPSGNSANFPVLSARYNLLTKTEQFDDAVWSKTGTSVTPNTVVAPDGTLIADKLVEDTSNGAHVITQAATISAGVTYVFSVYLKAAERSKARVMASSLGSLVNVDLASGTLSGGSGPGYVSSSISGAGGDWYKVALTYTESTSGPRSQAIYLEDAGGNASYQGNGTSGIYIWGADIRVANDALNQPAYQRVNTATDYDTVGFKPYLSFNGVNQWLQTNSIDFTYGDKMFVSAGVRKLSDVVGCIAETSSDASVNNGAFYVINRGVSSNDYLIGLRGTSFVYDQFFVAPPTTSVIAFSTDIGQVSRADELKTRLDGAAASVTRVGATAGTGNYGNYPLYIGARAGSSLWFDGRLYSLVVAGKQARTVEIASTERYLNQKTGAY